MNYKEILSEHLSEFKVIEDNHKNINDRIDLLLEEGYELNEFAKEFLMIFGGIKIKGRGKQSKSFVEISFDPCFYAQGEFDRMSIYNPASEDILFPVGGLYDYTIFIGRKGTFYIADWMNLYKCAESSVSFFENVFSDEPKLTELYSNTPDSK